MSPSSQPGHSGPTGSAGVRQFLSFRVGAEEYAIDILAVQEIRGHTAVTPLPQTPPWVRGAMNLRGVIVPVLDVQQRLGGPPLEYGKFSVIIVVSVTGRQVGLLVDAVNDVVDLSPGVIDPPPDVGAGSSSFVEGLGRHGERLFVLLQLQPLVA